MISKKHRNLLGKSPLVVGTIASPEAMKVALGLHEDALDLLELRIDALPNEQGSLCHIASLRPPILLTVRDFSEGGCIKLSPTKRIALYEQFLDRADLVDIELRSLRNSSFKSFAQSARNQGCALVCSFHDFRGTPSKKKLHLLAKQALEAGADLFKVATQAYNPADLTRLLSFLTEEDRLPLAVMGMGSMGKISRLLLAHCGSILNYGFLDKPQVPGQWPATLLKERLRELAQ